MTPFEASNDRPIPSLIPNKKMNCLNFHVRDYVRDYIRVPDKTNNYSKSFTTNWNTELFKIHRINHTSPVTYPLEDENK